MKNRHIIELMVGVLMLLGILALGMLAMRVSGLSLSTSPAQSYSVKADFDNIGALKVRAPVSIAGVKVGEVTQIQLNPTTFRATVTMLISKHDENIPVDTSASILTAGLLGANYISLSPGYEDANLKNGDTIQITHPALILEDLIGQLVFSIQGGDKDKDTKKS